MTRTNGPITRRRNIALAPQTCQILEYIPSHIPHYLGNTHYLSTQSPVKQCYSHSKPAIMLDNSIAHRDSPTISILSYQPYSNDRPICPKPRKNAPFLRTAPSSRLLAHTPSPSMTHRYAQHTISYAWKLVMSWQTLPALNTAAGVPAQLVLLVYTRTISRCR